MGPWWTPMWRAAPAPSDPGLKPARDVALGNGHPEPVPEACHPYLGGSRWGGSSQGWTP